MVEFFRTLNFMLVIQFLKTLHRGEKKSLENSKLALQFSLHLFINNHLFSQNVI